MIKIKIRMDEINLLFYASSEKGFTKIVASKVIILEVKIMHVAIGVRVHTREREKKQNQ